MSNKPILAIDPGASNCGLSLVSFDKNILTVNDTVLYTPKLNKNNQSIIGITKDSIEVYGDRFLRLELLSHWIDGYLSINTIEEVACEAPFYSSFRPSAYGALVETVFAIKTLLYKRNIMLHMYEPLLVKKRFSGKALANKDLMRSTLENKISDGTIQVADGVDVLSEHVIDSIAVGYCHFLK